MRPTLTSALVLCTACALTACVPMPEVTTTLLGSERIYPATADSTRIPLYAVAKPECPFDEIALIVAQGYNSGDDVLAALRSKARAIGGQAIVGYATGQRRDTETRSGTAIRFRSGDCTR